MQRFLVGVMVMLAACGGGGGGGGGQPLGQCESAADCNNGDDCVGGQCQGTSHDACGVAGLACADGASCVNVDDNLTCACDANLTGQAFDYCVPAKYTKLVAAGGFTCGLASTGAIWCWGTNYYGDLGDGTALSRTRPTRIGDATDWIDVSIRRNEGCGLRADHSLWCWGDGETGQLGDGKSTTSYTPVQVVSDKPGVGWSQVSVGRGNTCAIHRDGSLACWGQDRATSTNAATPVAIGSDTDWTAISAGESSCGLRDGGHLYCWGYSKSGALGLGSVTTQLTPALVGSDTWTSIRVGYYNACGIRSDGALLCWGAQPLLLAALQYGNTPQQIGTATDWQTIDVSYGAVIGLRAGGKAYAWGDNNFGELAQPLDDTGEVVEPTPLGDPALVWSLVTPGNTHGCGITNDQAYCWGSISDGLLGDGETTTCLAPTQLVDERWTAVVTGTGGVRGLRQDGALMSSGYLAGLGSLDPVWSPMQIDSHVWSAVVESTDFLRETCALRGGTPYCWGDNTGGQLGIGDGTPTVLAPTAVSVPAGSQWTEIATSDHACAIRSDGALFCWGDNFAGQLGDGSHDARTTPPATPLAGTWRHIAVTARATCAIQGDRTLWCWGDDVTGQAGNANPTQVGTDRDWDTLTLTTATPSGLELCGLKTGGTLWCWGMTSDGQTVPAPTQVGSDTHWKSIAIGVERCGIKTDGTLWCWDNNDILGDGSPLTLDPAGNTLRALAPTQIGSDTDWQTVSTGGPACGVKADGRVLCWGRAAAPKPDFTPTPVAVK